MEKREIKFRFWNGASMKEVGTLEFFDFGEIHINEELVLKEPIHLMQYTGLKDKNGKEIYEGDVVKCSDNRVAKVIFGETGWMIESKPFSKMEIRFSEENSVIRMNADRYGKLKNTEVIGNIYENPDLLTPTN